jgi:hypothetical protein
MLRLNFGQLPAVAFQRMRMVHRKGLFHYYAVLAASFLPALVVEAGLQSDQCPGQPRMGNQPAGAERQ